MRALTLAVIVGIAASLSACDDPSKAVSPDNAGVRATDYWPYPTAIRPGSTFTLATYEAQFLPQATASGDTIVGGTMVFTSPADSANNVFRVCYSNNTSITKKFTYTSTRFGNVTWQFSGVAEPDSGRKYADGTLAYFRNAGSSPDTRFGLWSNESVTCAG